MCHSEDEVTKVSAFLLRYLQLIMVLKCDIYVILLRFYFCSSAASEREGGNMIKICHGSSAKGFSASAKSVKSLHEIAGDLTHCGNSHC